MRFLVLLAIILTGWCRADVLLSEFLADNTNGLKDEDDSRQDWIELYNSGASAVSLNGWWLTDDSTKTAKWQIPNVSISAGGTLLIWASGKNRRVPGQPLHTNFSLGKSGEYLGLYKPAALTGLPELVDHFTPQFPAQATDVSYGLSYGTSTTTILAPASPGKYKFPTSATNYAGTNYAAGELGSGAVDGWNRNLNFNDSGWTDCISGLGYDANGVFSGLVGTNIQSQMRYTYNSVLARFKFNVPNPSAYSHFKLRMKYEDGCTVFLNNTATPVAAHAAPATPAWNSTTTNASAATWQQWWETTIPASSILAGDNLLAIQGYNTSTGSSDFLILPEVVGVSTIALGAPGYFATPTPNASNGATTSGPLVYGASPEDPAVPRPTGTAASPALIVSVKAIQTANPIAAVRVIPRIMYNAESAAITMLDNGVAPDTVAGDKTYTATIPTNTLTYGQMLRWRFEVQDSAGVIGKLPAYLSTTDSPQYFGTVAQRGDLAYTQLPVLDWFVEGAPSTGPTASAFRGSCYYLGYFYDNIGHEIHGQSTAGMTKKSYDFDSNTGYRFLWKEGEEKVKDLNVLSNYADKTKTRNTLSHEVGMMMGAPYHFCHPVRMHLNGAFHGVMDLMEDGDDRMLERNGLDPEGAFYKIYAENMSSGPEKKTRQTEPNTDINTLSSSLDPALPLATRRAYAYDNINIPAAVNYLVLRQLNSDGDHGHKNYYLYRDTNGTGEWQPIVWDVDLTHGHNWNGDNNSGGYFNDTLCYSNALNRHANGNRLYNLILETPEFQQMFARRMRTAMDNIMQAPGTTNGVLETRMRAIAASIDPDPGNPSPLTDGDLDRAKWGMSFGIDNRPREEVERLVTGYFPQRRAFLFDQSASRPLVNKSGVAGGEPLPDSPQAVAAGGVIIQSLDYYPSAESQNAEYVILKNTTATAVDLSGWTLGGAIDHTFPGGTVIPAGDGSAAQEYRGLLHVVKNAAAFRSRVSGPKGGENRLIQGNYSGQLSSRGESLTLKDNNGTTIASFSYAGNPTAPQQFLKLTEIHYNPADPSTAESLAFPGVNNDDFEFIELMNTGPTAIDLTGMTFTAGIGFAFPAVSLAPAARVVVAKSPAAFLLRHPGFTGVLGGYDDNLSNGGERLELTEASGEIVFDLSYDDAWYPVTDGNGYSLVVRSITTPYSEIDAPASWVMSPTTNGSPGQEDALATIAMDNLSQTYTGSQISPLITTAPPGLAVQTTYNDLSAVPVNTGSYTVVARTTAPNYDAMATGTLVIAKAPQLLTLDVPAGIPLDGPGIDLAPANSSGLTPTLAVITGGASLTGNHLTLHAAGLVTVRVSHGGGPNHQAAADLDRTLTVTTSYAASHWRAQYFTAVELADDAVSGALADPDGDGFNNMIEYAVRSHPRMATPAAPPVEHVLVDDMGQLFRGLSFRRRVPSPGILLDGAASDDLVTWRRGPLHVVPFGIPVPHGDGTESVILRSTIPIGGSPREFLRLEANTVP